MIISIGTTIGTSLKEIKKLINSGYKTLDRGTYDEESVDYPDLFIL